MRLSRYIPFVITAAGLVALQSSTPGYAATFNLTTPLGSPPANSSVKSYLDSGINLAINQSNSTGDTNNNTINVTGAGLCAWTLVDSSAGRCGYGTTPGSGISAFQMSFDKPIAFNSFNVSVFETASISQGTIGFSLDGTNFTNFNFTGTGTIPVAFQTLSANQTIYVQTSATLQSGSNTGIFRLGSMDVREVPGPLPLLSVGAALGMTQRCRRLSARIHRSAALTSR